VSVSAETYVYRLKACQRLIGTFCVLGRSLKDEVKFFRSEIREASRQLKRIKL